MSGHKYDGAKTGPINANKPRNEAKTSTARQGAILTGKAGTDSKGR